MRKLKKLLDEWWDILFIVLIIGVFLLGLSWGH